MSDIQIQITENGPYKVTGDIELLDYDGNPVQTRGGACLLYTSPSPRDRS